MPKTKSSNTYSEVRSRNYDDVFVSSDFEYWAFRHPLTETLWPRFVYNCEKKGSWFIELKGFPYFSLDLTISGSAVYTVNGKKFVSHAGDLLIAPPSCNKRTESLNRARLKSIGLELYGKSLLSIIENLNLNQGLKISLKKPDIFEEKCKKLFNLLRAKKTGTENLVSALCYEILVYVSANHITHTEDAYPDILTNVLRAIHQAPSENFTCGELAARAHCSEPTLYRLFQKHLQTSPQNYIMSYKMELAKKYIQIGDLSHKEVAAHLGFQYPCYFSRVYKQYWGFSPNKTNIN